MKRRQRVKANVLQEVRRGHELNQQSQNKEHKLPSYRTVMIIHKSKVIKISFVSNRGCLTKSQFLVQTLYLSKKLFFIFRTLICPRRRLNPKEIIRTYSFAPFTVLSDLS